MALEGILDTGIKSNSGGKGIKFYWYVKSQSGLTSYCHYTIYSYGDSGYTMCRNVVLKINGSDVGISTAEFKAYDGTVIDEGDFNITHNSSTGAASFTVSITAAMFTYADNLSASTTFYPNTISVETYAASTISSASNVTLGNACSVSWTPAVSSMGYKLIFSIGSYSKTISGISPNRTSSYTYTGFTIPLDVANYISSSSKTGTMTVKLYSYKETSCTTQVGSYSSKTFTVTIPDSSSTRPSISMSLSAVNDLSSPFDSIYLQGKTKVQATFTDSAKYGASISSRSITINNTVDSSSPYQILLTVSGSVTVKGTVKDSRGFTNSTEKNISVIQYGSPAIIPYSNESSVLCARCDDDGVPSSTGTHIRIKAGRKYSPVNVSGEQKNFCSLGYRYAASGSEMPNTFTSLLSKNDVSTNYVDVTLTEIELSVKSSYVVEIQAIDDVGDSHIMSFVIGTESIFVHMKPGGKGIGIGKYAEEDYLVDIASDWIIRTKSVEFSGDGWKSLGLSGNVEVSGSSCGRNTNGDCWYRVVNENHVYVAFNCAFSYSGSFVNVNSNTIPEEYRPARNVYAICATGGRAVARIIVTPAGNVVIDWIQILSSSSATTSSTVNWIDGYIDYWI